MTSIDKEKRPLVVAFYFLFLVHAKTNNRKTPVT